MRHEVTTDSGSTPLRRFRSQTRAAAYSGLVPGQRESAGRKRETGITKEGSRILRWALVETAWRLVYHSRRWGSVFEGLCKRRGPKRAIIAVARRLLCMMVAMSQSGRRCQAAMVVSGRFRAHAYWVLPMSVHQPI